MNNRIYRHIITFLSVVTVVLLAATFWFASRPESVWAALLLGVISGGVISVLLTVIVQKLGETVETDDVRRAFIADLALNVRWAKYNTVALEDDKYVVWVPFRLDTFLTALRYQNRLHFPENVWSDLLEATDRLHAFNQDWASYHESLSLDRDGVRGGLEGAMKDHATRLYLDIFPRIVKALLPDAEPARLSYKEDWDARVMNMKSYTP